MYGCSSCFCWTEPRRATAVIGVFSALTSTIQIMIIAAVFTVFYGQTAIPFNANPTTNEIKVYILYLVLSVLDFFNVLFSIIMLCGNERCNERRRRCMELPWICLIPIYVIYESVTNIYYFYNSFNFLFNPVVGVGAYLVGGESSGFQVVPLIYWIVKDALLIYGWVYLLTQLYSALPVRTIAAPPPPQPPSPPKVINVYEGVQPQPPQPQVLYPLYQQPTQVRTVLAPAPQPVLRRNIYGYAPSWLQPTFDNA